MQRRTDSGFSLIEALVAMTVLSVSAVTILSTVEEHTRAIAAMSDRATARWIAENRLVELGLGLTDLAEVTHAGRRDWWVRTTLTDTSDPDLVRVDISVGPVGDRDQALARLTGFVDRSGQAT